MKLNYISSVLLLAIGIVEAAPVANPNPGGYSHTHSVPSYNPKPYRHGDYRGQRWRHSGKQPLYGGPTHPGTKTYGDKWSKPSHYGKQPSYGGPAHHGDHPYGEHKHSGHEQNYGNHQSKGGKTTWPKSWSDHKNAKGQPCNEEGKPVYHHLNSKGAPMDVDNKRIPYIKNAKGEPCDDNGHVMKKQPWWFDHKDTTGQPSDNKGKPVYHHMNQRDEPCDEKDRVIPYKKNAQGQVCDVHGAPMKKAAPPQSSKKTTKNMYDSKTFGPQPPAEKVCLKWVTVEKDDSCNSIVERQAGLSDDSCTKDDLIWWNKDLHNDCSGIKKVKKVCIKVPTWYPKPECKDEGDSCTVKDSMDKQGDCCSDFVCKVDNAKYGKRSNSGKCTAPKKVYS